MYDSIEIYAATPSQSLADFAIQKLKRLATKCSLFIVSLTLLSDVQPQRGTVRADENAKTAKTSEVSKRIAVPDSASLKKATKRLLEKYGKRFDEATTREARQKLAEEMLSAYLEARKKADHDDPAFDFVNLRQAQDLALDARNYNLAHAVIDAMEQRFEIDSLIMRFAILAAEDADPSVSPQDKCRLGLVLMSDAAWSARADVVKRAAKLTEKAAEDIQTKLSRKGSDEKEDYRDIIGQISDYKSRLDRVLQVQTPKVEFQNALKASKGTPAENTALGKKACFELNDWETGLPLLAYGSDCGIKKIAAEELKRPTDGPSMFAIGKLWWEIAKRDDENKNDYALRAKYWFDRARPKLSLIARVEMLKNYGINPEWKIPIDVSYSLKELSGLYGAKAPEVNTIRGGISKPSCGGPPRVASSRIGNSLTWLARHQSSDGHWGLEDYKSKCIDKSCTGRESRDAETAATAIALLPFLGAGELHVNKGRFKNNVDRGLTWLINQQQPDGDLAKGAAKRMYSQALATLALCETYGITGDKKIGAAAQRGIDFIIAQNKAEGGLPLTPGKTGDTSVIYWQICALKVGKFSGLNVSKNAFPAVDKLFDTAVAVEGNQFGNQARVTTSVEGLLCRQFLGAPRDSKAVEEGIQYILTHEPDADHQDVYYCFVATQYMHLFQSTHREEWQVWSYKMREILSKTQNIDEEKCAYGSWDPSNDVREKEGGRVMKTALATLTLEVYYRYLGLFKLDTAEPQR